MVYGVRSTLAGALTIDSKENGGVKDEDYHVGSTWSRQRHTGKEDRREVFHPAYFHRRYLQGKHQERNRAGKKAKTYMDQGLLVPDELVVDLVVDRVKQDDCSNGYVLDGFPRTIPQAEALDKALAAMGEKMDYAINVEVPDENIVNRMSGRRACVDCGATYHIVYAPTEKEGICDKCGGTLILRDDDKPETVQKRLGVYHEQTQPLIDYYKEAGILRDVDGTIDIDDVFAEIVKILGE